MTAEQQVVLCRFGNEVAPAVSLIGYEGGNAPGFKQGTDIFNDIPCCSRGVLAMDFYQITTNAGNIHEKNSLL
jgi:hypothetical protein